ncbi:hypothetical protein MmiEs2_12630 [Methanimicrococcus stummii]|uniref:Uncharacterized protein n=1 Tax=Methanimicrococcus stummii TaxID=3028294 RepID=A0AA96V947_9EURY|nr:hypothetical protein [Methanimicrococcus sp. Es2]WNY29049.1 hypothetical protein MmiEs2_12630 [Methanimicrococcus sp. Es2]
MIPITEHIGFDPEQYLSFMIPFLLSLIPLYFIIGKAVQKAMKTAAIELKIEKEKDV